MAELIQVNTTGVPALDRGLDILARMIERRPLLRVFTRRLEASRDGGELCLCVFCSGPGEFTYGGSMRCPPEAHLRELESGTMAAHFVEELERGFAREYQRHLESLAGPESIQ